MLEFLRLTLAGVLAGIGIMLIGTLVYLFFVVPISVLWFLASEIKEATSAVLSLTVKKWQDKVTHWQRARFRREMQHITRHKNFLDAVTIVNAFRVLEYEEVDANVSYEFIGQRHSAPFNNPEDAARLLHTLVARAIAAAQRQAGVPSGVVLEYTPPGSAERDSASNEKALPVTSPIPA